MELPEDIDNIATEIVRRPYHGEDEPDYVLYLTIGRAILAERQRCADIIKARLPLYTDIGQINALRECRSSILSPSVKQET